MDNLLQRLTDIERMDINKWSSAPVRSTVIEARQEIERLTAARNECERQFQGKVAEICRLTEALDAAMYSLCTDDYEAQQAVAAELKRLHQQTTAEK